MATGWCAGNRRHWRQPGTGPGVAGLIGMIDPPRDEAKAAVNPREKYGIMKIPPRRKGE
jgi:hypothetical protein